jgi:hypothetical protein
MQKLWLVQKVGDVPYHCIVMSYGDDQALLRADERWRGDDDQNERIDEADGLDKYVAQLAEEYTVKEIDRATAMTYINRALDGDDSEDICVVI